jgi:hypothetical protein
MIGQAFADEIFRIFQNDHPDVHLTVMPANPDVERMIAHVLAGGAAPPTAPRADGGQSP